MREVKQKTKEGVRVSGSLSEVGSVLPQYPGDCFQDPTLDTKICACASPLCWPLWSSC